MSNPISEHQTISIVVTIAFLVLGVVGFRMQTNDLQQQVEEVEQHVNRNLQEITQPNVLFETVSFGDRTNTFISLSYQAQETDDRLIWLSYETDAGTEARKILASHPFFYNLDWEHITDSQERVYLYQREVAYDSLTEFLANPPAYEKILADASMIARYFPNNQQILAFEDKPTALDQFDYILTTHAPIIQRGALSYFETTTDASNAKLSEEEKITWVIQVPDASEENPFMLGEIHVDYR